MNFTKSSNPAFKNAFGNQTQTSSSSEVMTLNGTINKTILSLLLVIAAATYTWKLVLFDGANAMTWTFGGAIGGFIVAMVTIFKKEWAPYTTPVYAALEGLFLGGVSALIAGAFTSEADAGINSNIVLQAVALTFGVFFIMLFAYRSGKIRATPKFTRGMIAALGGVAVFYIGSWILSLFGFDLSLFHGNGLIAIGINLVIVVIAALSLILDFDMIEKGVAYGAPRYMEWYGAFSLLITLVWLYLEILKLLARLASRD